MSGERVLVAAPSVETGRFDARERPLDRDGLTNLLGPCQSPEAPAKNRNSGAPSVV
jgi:hypothetical protein